MNESERTSQVLKRFRELSKRNIAWKFNDRVAHSRPDSMLAGGTHVNFVEFKMVGNKLTPGQLLELQKLAAAGFPAYVVYFEKEGWTTEVFKVYPDTPNLEYLDTCLTVDDLCHFLS